MASSATESSPPAEVTFELDEDGEHVWWTHHCSARDDWKPVPDPEGGPPYEWDPCRGGIEVVPEPQHMLPRGKEKCWTVVQREPLTVVPSILCAACGCHGFITNGVWVKA